MKEPNTNFQQEQLTKLKELGSYIRQTRLERGISIEDVSAETMIPPRVLIAIEKGSIQDLPEPVYIRELIKKFAMTVGLDGAKFHSAFPVEFNLSPNSPPSALHSSSRRRFSGFQLRSIHLYGFYFLLILFSVNLLANLVEPNRPEVKTAQQEEKPAVQSSLTVDRPENSRSLIVSRSSSKTPHQQPVTVDVMVKDRCWMRVMVDGKKEFEGMLDRDTHRSWVAKEHITLRAGNAGAVFVSFNDEQAKQLGKSGQVQEITYKP